MKIGFLRKILPAIFNGGGQELAAKAIPPNVPTESLFCQRVLANLAKKGKLSENSSSRYISQHENVHHVNHFIAGHHAFPESFHEPINSAYLVGRKSLSPEQILKIADMEFRRLPATDKEIITFRGLTKKPSGFAEHEWIENLRNTKKGQKVYFPGYLYTSPDIKWVRSAYSGDEGLLIELHILPGARVSQSGNEILTSRSTSWICKGNEKLEDKNGKYTKIILEYILPNESFLKA